MKRILFLLYFLSLAASAATTLTTANTVTKATGVHSFKSGTLCIAGSTSGCVPIVVSAIAGTTNFNIGTGGTLGTAAYTAATAYAASGAATSSGITMATARILGRTSASTGAIEEISAGSTLTLSAGSLGLNLASANTWTKAQSVTTSTLTDATNISVDASLSNNFKVTLAGSRTLDNPTNLVNGTTYNFIVIQDSGGSKTLAYGNKYLFAGGAKTLSTAANAVDLISCLYESVTDKLYCVLAKAFA